MNPIKVYSKLSPLDHLYLYWYSQIVEKQICSYDEFLPSESLIERYNSFVEQWEINFEKDPSHYEKTVDWDKDRKKTDYFKNKLQMGYQFEIWVGKLFKENGVDLGLYYDKDGQYSGENRCHIEIKHDMKLRETGNLYIEYMERLHSYDNWTKSGILKEDDCQYWLIGSFEEYYIFKKQTLIDIYNSLNRGNCTIPKCRFVGEKYNLTSKGYLLPRSAAKEYCISASIEDFIKNHYLEPGAANE